MTEQRPRVGETDGVGWMRRATTILLEHGLPSFPRSSLELGERVEWHWHAAPDVAAQLRSLHSLDEPAPMMSEELFGYRVDVDEAYPAGTLELVREDPVVIEAAL